MHLNLEFGIKWYQSSLLAAMDSIEELLTNPVTLLVDGIHLLSYAAKQSDEDSPTYYEAMNGLDVEGYHEAMQLEIAQLEGQQTWTLKNQATLPEGMNVLPSTWVYKCKCYPDCHMQKLKVHFCVHGDEQVEGVNFFDMYDPVVSWTAIHLMLILSMLLDLKTKQVDYSNAFVHAYLQEQVYIELPKEFEAEEDSILHLNKSLYGLK